MSLADVLRYRISEPPTIEEINNLPETVLREFVLMQHIAPGLFNVHHSFMAYIILKSQGSKGHTQLTNILMNYTDEPS